jgi:hypothetical protein
MSRHFRWEGPILIGRTAVDRVSVQLLQINDEDRVQRRRVLLEEGVFPPS